MKYKTAIKFYTETKNEQQLLFAYSEIENFLISFSEFKFYYKLNIDSLIEQKKPQFIEFCKNFKFKIADLKFQRGNFNETLIKYAIFKVTNDKTKSNFFTKEIKHQEKHCLNKISNIYFFLMVSLALFIIYIHFHLYAKNPKNFFHNLDKR